MNKEQTPIEWLLSKINVNESVWEEIEKYESIAKQKEQKHTQSKVLEALEREIPKFMRWCDKGTNTEVDNSDFEAFKEIAKNYIETEVKPKYQDKDERKNL